MSPVFKILFVFMASLLLVGAGPISVDLRDQKSRHHGTSNTSLPIDREKIQCQEKIAGPCSYYQCEGLIADYPEKVALVLPRTKSKIEHIRVHFHGHRFGTRYDQDLESMIESFDFKKSVCMSQDKAIFIPFSKGQGSTYSNYFKTKNAGKKFRELYLKLLQLLELEHSSIDLSLSGHSGGGQVVARIIKSNQDEQISDISLFDAMAFDEEMEIYRRWLESVGRKTLKIYAVAPYMATLENWRQVNIGGSYFLAAKKFVEDLPGQKIVGPTKLELDESTFREDFVFNQSYVSLIFQNNTAANHYTLVVNWWDFI